MKKTNVVSPFDWKNQPPKIDMSDLSTAQKNSYQQTAVVNRRRAQGIETSLPFSANSNDGQPQNFVVSMPDMPLHPTTIRAKRKKL
jgi:hypothetical protein